MFRDYLEFRFDVGSMVDGEQFRLNGYAVFPNSDVRRWLCVSKDEFTARAARIHRLRPSAPDGMTIVSVREAVSSAGRAYPLVAIHRERIRRGKFSVGRVVMTTQRAVRLMPISPDAEWEEDETRLFRDITLLRFGGAYESLLARLAKEADVVLR